VNRLTFPLTDSIFGSLNSQGQRVPALVVTRTSRLSHSGMRCPDTPGEEACTDSGETRLGRAASTLCGRLAGIKGIASTGWGKSRPPDGGPVYLIEPRSAREVESGTGRAIRQAISRYQFLVHSPSIPFPHPSHLLPQFLRFSSVVLSAWTRSGLGWEVRIIEVGGVVAV
jgi:hypothetical protein